MRVLGQEENRAYRLWREAGSPLVGIGAESLVPEILEPFAGGWLLEAGEHFEEFRPGVAKTADDGEGDEEGEQNQPEEEEVLESSFL